MLQKLLFNAIIYLFINMGAKPKTKPIYKIEYQRNQISAYIGISTMFSDTIKKKLEKLSDKSLVIFYKYCIKSELNNFSYWEDLGYWSVKELEDRGIFINRLWKFIFDSDKHLLLPPENDSD